MRRYQKPETKIESQGSGESMEANSGAFDVAKELELCEEILRREVRNLMSESCKSKLSEKSARDLTSYIKLLSEMRDEQREGLRKLSTEELEKLAKK